MPKSPNFPAKFPVPTIPGEPRGNGRALLGSAYRENRWTGVLGDLGEFPHITCDIIALSTRHELVIGPDHIHVTSIHFLKQNQINVIFDYWSKEKTTTMLSDNRVCILTILSFF